MKRFTILITGSRTWDNVDSIKHRIIQTLSEWLEENPTYRTKPFNEWLTIVHGGCPSGADRLADILGRSTFNCKVIVYPADWAKYQKRAGPLRNLHMVQKSGADACLAFIRDKSKGATQCRNEAKRFGMPTETFMYDLELERYPVKET
jgi:hypothetical protein